MAVTVEGLLREALALSEGDRVLLANQIIATSNDPEVAEAWSIEIKRRIDLLDTGEMQEFPVEEALAALKRKLAT